MNLDDITPLVLTFNEADNLKRTLDGLSWALKILLIDSGSTDDTLSIASSFPQVQVLTRTFDDFANQRNFGLDAVTSAWVLSLDADHWVSPALRAEIAALDGNNHQAFDAPFHYRIWGRRVRCAILPPRPVLFQTASCRYVPDGHAERLETSGTVSTLHEPVTHDDRKPLSRWISAQDGYAQQEATKLRNATTVSIADRVRRHTWLAPLTVFLYVLFVRGGIVEGRRGLFYAYQRLLAELNLALHQLQNNADRQPDD